MRRAPIGHAGAISRAVISTIGQDRPGVVNQIAKVVHDLNLSIEDSRMTVLGGEFAVLMSVTGGALHLQRLETRLVKLAEEMDLAFLFRLTGDRGDVQGRVPYTVSVTAMDHPGIVHLVAGFFSSRNINIFNLDTVTERAIMHAINEVSARHTTLIISHRLSTVVDADRIVLLDNGAVLETGNHAELLAQEGKYAEMWAVQRKERGATETLGSTRRSA